jgi:hypothetical protein
VIGDAIGLDALDQPREPIEMPGVQPRRRAERQADAVQAHRVALARLVQHRKRRATVGEEVLGVNFDEAERWRVFEQCCVVRLAQADADHRGGRCAIGHDHFFIAALASSIDLPPIFAQVPLAT